MKHLRTLALGLGLTVGLFASLLPAAPAYATTPAPSVVSLTSSVNPTVSGGSTTLTATAQPSLAPPPITFRGTVQGAAGDNPTFTQPSGLTAYEVILQLAHSMGSATPPQLDPAWNISNVTVATGTDANGKGYSYGARIADWWEPSSYTTTGNAVAETFFAVSGANRWAPVESVRIGTNASNVSTIPASTPTRNNSWHVIVLADSQASGGTVTPPAGYTLLAGPLTVAGSGTLYSYYKDLGVGSAGVSTGVKTATWSGSSGQGMAMGFIVMPVSAKIKVIQAVLNGDGGSAGSGLATTINPVANGNTVLLRLAIGDDQPVPTSIDDGQGNQGILTATWRDSWGSETYYDYRWSNVTNGMSVVNVAFAADWVIGVDVLEVQGLDPVNPLSTVTTQVGTVMSLTQSMTYTPGGANELAWIRSEGKSNATNSVAISLEGGYSQPQQFGWNYGSSFTDDTGTAGPKTFTFTQSGEDTTDITVVTYKAANVPLTGTVTFSDGATTLGTSTLSSGSANLAVSSLSVGSHSLTATYSGDTANAGSSSPVLAQVVNAGSAVPTGTSVALSSSANPSSYSDSVTFTSTVTGSNPSGTVTFRDGATTLGTGTIAAGVAMYSTSVLSVATHSITAVYGGDANNAASTSPALTQIVEPGGSSVTVSSNPNPATVGSSITFSATVTGFTPTGTVTFTDETVVLGTGTLSAGVASYTTNTLSIGSHRIWAVYGGDANNGMSTSVPWTQGVTRSAITASLASSVNPSVYGTATMLTAKAAISTVMAFQGGVDWGMGSDLGFDQPSGLTANEVIFQFAHNMGAATPPELDPGSSISSVTVAAGTDANGKGYTYGARVTGLQEPDTYYTWGDDLVQASFALAGANRWAPVESIRMGTNASNVSAIPASIPTRNNSWHVIVLADSQTSSGGIVTPPAGYTLLAGPLTIPGKGQMYSYYKELGDSCAGVSTGVQTATWSGASGQGMAMGFIVVPASAKIKVIQSVLNGGAIASGGALSTTIKPVANGNTVLLRFYIGDGQPVPTSIDDGQGNQAVLTATWRDSQGSGSYYDYRWSNVTNGMNVVNLAYSAGSTQNVDILEVQGLDPVNPFSTLTTQPGTVSSLTQSMAYTPGGANELAWIRSKGKSNGTHSVAVSLDGGYSQPQQFDWNYGSSFTDDTGIAGPKTFILTQSGQDMTDITVVTYKAANVPLTGTMTFQDGAMTLGSVNMVSGSASLVVSSLSAGMHNLTATYSGDSTYASVTSSALPQVVNAAAAKASTNTSLSTSANPSSYANSMTFTATVTGAAPTGSVTFMDGVSTLGTGTLSSGIATYATNILTLGNHSITAVYSGDVNNASSTSTILIQSVLPAAVATSITLSTNLSSINLGEQVILSAAVNGSSPTGQVTFLDGSISLGVVNLVSGAATLPTTALAMGTHTIAAIYSGDAGNQPSISLGVTVTVGGGTMTYQYGYDVMGRRTTSIDPNGLTTNIYYDALGRRIQTQQPPNAGTTAPTVTQFDYNAADSLTRVADPRNLATNYSPDGLGNMTALSSPDSGNSGYTYDAAGNLLSKTDARGKLTSYSYDALNRLTGVSHLTGTATTLEYDGGATPTPSAMGELTKITDESGTLSYAFDSAGRLTTKTQTTNGRTFVVRYTWGDTGSAVDKLTSITYPSGNKVNYAYDSYGGVTAITVSPVNPNGTGVGSAIPFLSTIGYNASGNVSGWSWASGLMQSIGFDAYGMVNGYNLGNPNGAGSTAGVRRTVERDAAGRITSYTHTNNGATQGNLTQVFGYDSLNRLLSANQGTTSLQYSYDANNNRTAKVVNSTTYTNTVSNSSNRLTQAQDVGGTTTIQSDAAGNVISDGIYSYTYSDRGRLATAITSGGTVSYRYNALEQRVYKSGPTAVVPTGASYYVYDEAGKLLGEYDANGNPIYETVYLASNVNSQVSISLVALPVGVLKQTGTAAGNNLATTPYNVYADQLGAPRMVTRASDEAITWRWDGAESYGGSAPDQNPSGLGVFTYNQRLPGQTFDAETGLFQNWNREYNPRIGRYIESDPIGLNGGINTYAYVNGNPVSYFDPRGKELLMGAVGAVVGGLVNGVNAYSNGGSPLQGAAIGFIAGGVAGLINTPWAAGAIAGALVTAGNRYGLGITNAPDAVRDFAIGVGGGVVGGAVCGAIGGVLGRASLPMSANGLARNAAGEIGNQIGQTAGSVGVNNVVNYSNGFAF